MLKELDNTPLLVKGLDGNTLFSLLYSESILLIIEEDELVEVTPNFIRIRKRILNTEARKKFDAKKKND